MRYRYPKINNWLSFNEIGFGEYEATDYLTDETYILGDRIAWFAMRLDGRTDPFSVSKRLSAQEVKTMLRELDRNGLLRRSMVLDTSARGLYYTLWTPKAKRETGRISFVLNRLLMILFLPVFLLGCVSFFTVFPDLSGRAAVPIAVIGGLAGLALHEIAHAVASLACGGRVFEIGLMLQLPFSGAYVMTDDSKVKGALKRAQIDAAGIEANLLLAGLAFLLGAVLPWNTKGFFYAALINAELALMNVLLIDGLDGAGIMSELLGIRSLGKTAKTFFRDRRKSFRRRRAGRPDAVYSTICFSTALVQPVHAVLLILNVWVILSWIL